MKKIILCLLLLSNLVQAQTMSRSIWFSDDDSRGFAIHQVEDGYIIPIQYWALLPGGNNAADESFGVMKIDKEGNEVWKKYYTASPKIVGMFTQENSLLEGDKIIVALNDADSTGKDDILWHLDLEGDTIFTKEYSNDIIYQEYTHNIIKNHNNNLLVYGIKQVDTDSFWIYIKEIDDNGNILFEKNLIQKSPSYYWAIPLNIQRTADGYIAGYRNISGRTHIMKLDMDYNILWIKPYTDSQGDEIGYISVLNDSTYILGHLDKEKGAELDLFWNNNPPVIAALDTAGNYIWQTWFISNFATYHLNKIHIAKNGDLIGIGYFQGGRLSGWIWRVSPTGEILWSHIYEPADPGGECSFFNITEDEDEMLLLTGFMIDSVPDVGPRKQNVWFMKLYPNGCLTLDCNETGSLILVATQDIKDVPNANSDVLEVKVAPNPAKAFFNISIQNADFSKGELSIYNTQGQLIAQQKLRQRDSQISCTSLENGVYILKLHSNSGNWVGKVLVQH